MIISATVKNSLYRNEVSVQTNGVNKELVIPPKAAGRGASVNGGELLFLAIATCFCNDIYREAPRRNISVTAVTVTVTGEFGSEGEAASAIRYNATIESDAPEEEIQKLIADVDAIAEIHNTLRKGVNVTLQS